MQKHWPILQINETIGKGLENIPVTSFKRTNNFRNLFCVNTIVNSKVKKQQTSNKKGDVTHVTARKTKRAVGK